MSLEFVNVTVNTSNLYVAKSIDYGTVAIVGVGNNNGSTPILVGSYGEASTLFENTDLGLGVKLAFANGASKVWAVDCASKTLVSVKNALTTLEAINCQFVALANIVETDDNAFISDALAGHVSGSPATERIGVFMLPAGASTQPTALAGLKGSANRLFGIAHNSTKDVACAVAGMLASLKPWESPLLKGITGISQTIGFTTTLQRSLETAQINVLCTPTYLNGGAFVLGSDFTLGTNGLQYIDTRRVVDDIVYKLKSNLTSPAIIGQLQINYSGLSVLMGKIAGIMQNCVNIGEIDAYEFSFPIITALAKQPDSRTDGDNTLIATARTSRGISGEIVITYAGVLHSISINMDMVV